MSYSDYEEDSEDELAVEDDNEKENEIMKDLVACSKYG